MSRSQEFNVGSSPVPEIQAGARRYQQMNGMMVPESNYGAVVMPHAQSRAMGTEYMRMPDFDKRAVPAYHQMAEEVGRQFDHLTNPVSKGGMGLNVEVTRHDPYGQGGNYDQIFPEFKNDVVNNNRMQVLHSAETGGHPLFTDDQNNMFRAVHDYFGHLGSGRGIDMHGEDAAYQKHAAMFSPLARQALATETRGQNGALQLTGEFQNQKIGLLSPQYTGTGSLPAFGEGAARARAEAVQRNRSQGII